MGKGNHIDDQTAEECSDVGIDFAKAKAGYSWGYLQFNMKREKQMFIIKNARYFDVEDFPKAKGTRKGRENESYLKRLSRINMDVDFPAEPSLFSENEMVRLLDEITLKQLEESAARELEESFNSFYIITYEVDMYHAISTIKVLMPNPRNNKAYLIEDLSELIAKSPVTFDENDYEVLVEDGFDAPDVPAAADYGIVALDDIEEKEN